MERKLKHLEFIQGVVNRLSTNSFLLKGWSVVLVSALFALAAADTDPNFVLLAYIPAVMFWGLDGYFLSVERAYRKHYDAVRAMKSDDIDFCMDCDKQYLGGVPWIKATLSPTLLAFHLVVIASVSVASWVLSRGATNG